LSKEEIDEAMGKKENADNHKDYQRSPLKVSGDPPRIRTADTLLKSVPGQGLRKRDKSVCFQRVQGNGLEKGTCGYLRIRTESF
jgi:hypothetical protein